MSGEFLNIIFLAAVPVAELRVALPVRNYLEARGAVLDGCAPWPEPPSSGAAATAPDQEAAPAGARAPTPYPRPANRP